jgi:tungstate transport system substrate-binding protein
MANLPSMHVLAVALLSCCIAMAAACQPDRPRLRLATTTSTRDSGLLDALLPIHEREAKVRVDVIAIGTGKALELGRAGDVDVLLVHAREAEDGFMAAGHGSRREDVMHNSFELLGPPGDPARVEGLEITAALARIAATKPPFVSRGDESGTHQKEKALWRDAGGLDPWKRYYETGQGMGESLMVANEKDAYIFSDRATYLAFQSKIRLVPLAASSERMNNRYGAIVVRGSHPGAAAGRANAFVDYLVSSRGQQIIGDFTVAGERVFFPAHARAE